MNCTNPGEYGISVGHKVLCTCARHLPEAVAVASKHDRNGVALVKPGEYPACQVPASAPFGFTSQQRLAIAA